MAAGLPEQMAPVEHVLNASFATSIFVESWDFFAKHENKSLVFLGGGVRGKGNGERGDEWSLEGLEGLLG